ncbi:unnamed protein product [Dracunculus medinensis]|uniref:Secreted protein n=1 Tax=Dracunculus medinensis TaxID=318479 RepID=A0A0N4U2S1_DRAME|nr:unnamed protein product [Dracunculus medinensis]
MLIILSLSIILQRVIDTANVSSNPQDIANKLARAVVIKQCYKTVVLSIVDEIGELVEVVRPVMPISRCQDNKPVLCDTLFRIPSNVVADNLDELVYFFSFLRFFDNMNNAAHNIELPPNIQAFITTFFQRTLILDSNEARRIELI